MKLSFATLGCPAWNMAQIVANARAYGFDGVELRGIAGEHIGADEPADSRAHIRQAFASAGLQIACIMGYSRFTMEDAAERRQNGEQLVKLMEVARDVGCPTLRIFGGALDPAGREAGTARLIESLRQIAPAAQRLGVRMAMETHDDWCHGQNALAVIRGVGSPMLGICWDIANSSLVEPMTETFAAIRDHVIHVHFKDLKHLPDGKEFPTLPGAGDGQVDLPKALTLLRDAGYKGWLSFEWEKKWVPEIPEPELAFPHWLKYTTELMARLGVPRG